MRAMAIILFCGLIVLAALVSARAGDYPTNLLHFNVANDYLPKAKPVILSTNPVSGRSPTNVLPVIYFDDAPMITAITALAEQGKINFLIDPHYRHGLLGGSRYHPGDQLVNLRLKDVSVDDAFTAMLKPRGFVMLDDPVSGVSLITRYSHRPYVLDGSLLHMETNVVSGTNGVFCPVSLDDVPVDLALTRLIAESRLKIRLDSDVTNDGYWSLNMHTERTTAKQAIYAICQACEYEIVQDDDGQVVIRHKPMKHYHHVPIH